jgi:hypothetical protein
VAVRELGLLPRGDVRNQPLLGIRLALHVRGDLFPGRSVLFFFD